MQGDMHCWSEIRIYMTLFRKKNKANNLLKYTSEKPESLAMTLTVTTELNFHWTWVCLYVSPVFQFLLKLECVAQSTWSNLFLVVSNRKSHLVKTFRIKYHHIDSHIDPSTDSHRLYETKLTWMNKGVSTGSKKFRVYVSSCKQRL